MLYFFIFSLCLIEYSVSAGVHSALAGGARPAAPHQYPWIVSLDELATTRDNPEGIFRPDCGSTLVAIPGNDQDSNIVITAAHCIVELDFMDGRMQPVSRELRPIEYFQLKLGSHTQTKVEEGEVVRGVIKMVISEKWDHKTTGMVGDIAILQLNESVKFSETIKPIALPEKGDLLVEGTECILAGWGKIGAEKNADELYEINVKIQNGDACTTEWNKQNPSIKFDPTIAYCAGPGGQKPSMCDGDSGSPLFCKQNDRYVFHGIASVGSSPCGVAQPPSAYTKVVTYIDWINETIDSWTKAKDGN